MQNSTWNGWRSAKIFGRDGRKFFLKNAAGFASPCPRDIPSLQTSIGGIALHAITASNVECFNQTIFFEKQGTCIPIIREEGGAASHLVAPLSVFGETGTHICRTWSPRPIQRIGRYTIRNGRIELQPALRPDGKPESYANLRLWVTNGKLGSKVGPGQVTGFLKKEHDLWITPHQSNFRGGRCRSGRIGHDSGSFC